MDQHLTSVVWTIPITLNSLRNQLFRKFQLIDNTRNVSECLRCSDYDT